MAFKILDGVQQFATGSGVGGLTLGAATQAYFRAMDTAGMLDGDTTRVRIQQENDATKWEVVLVELNSGVIERTFDDLSSSPTGDLIDFPSGNKVVSGVVVGGDLVARRTYGKQTVAIVSNVLTIDTVRVGYASVTVNANISSVVLQKLLPGTSFQIELVGNGTAYTQSWTDWTWLTGTPTLSSDLGKRDLATVFSPDGEEILAIMNAQYF